jgi:hypothetical protein
MACTISQKRSQERRLEALYGPKLAAGIDVRLACVASAACLAAGAPAALP